MDGLSIEKKASSYSEDIYPQRGVLKLYCSLPNILIFLPPVTLFGEGVYIPTVQNSEMPK